MVFSAVIPAFNEEGILFASVRELVTVLERVFPDGFEIVIVDDGSTDGTAAVISMLRNDSRVRGVSIVRNRGKGAALKAGVQAARGELVLICDADMATTPVQLPRFVEEISGGADLVIGSRRQMGARVLKAQSSLRTSLGRGHSWLANRALGMEISDYTCGFKLFRGDIARWLFAQCNAERWGYDVEILAIAQRAGLRIREVPVEWRDGPKSGVRVLPAIATTLVEMFRTWSRYRRGRAVRGVPPGARWV